MLQKVQYQYIFVILGPCVSFAALVEEMESLLERLLEGCEYEQQQE